MPLVTYLREGSNKPSGWHRNEERQARGMQPVKNTSAQLESWERQLAVVETLLLGGGTPYASFKDLAHGWGRRKGFHLALINNVCERRGDIIRKRKSEIGMTVSPPKRLRAPVTENEPEMIHGNEDSNHDNNNDHSNTCPDNSTLGSDNNHESNHTITGHHKVNNDNNKNDPGYGVSEHYDPNQHQYV